MFYKRSRSGWDHRHISTDETDLQLTVAPDWTDMVNRADEIAGIIDRHLDYESALQGRDLSTARLCPEQKGNLVSDLLYALR